MRFSSISSTTLALIALPAFIWAEDEKALKDAQTKMADARAAAAKAADDRAQAQAAAKAKAHAAKVAEAKAKAAEAKAKAVEAEAAAQAAMAAETAASANAKAMGAMAKETTAKATTPEAKEAAEAATKAAAAAEATAAEAMARTAKAKAQAKAATSKAVKAEAAAVQAEEPEADAKQEILANAINGLTGFGVNIAGETMLVRTEVASAMAPMFANTLADWYLSLGVTVTSTLPANIEDRTEYLDAQMTFLDGGVANVYFSFFSDRRSAAGDGDYFGNRRTAVDRLYFTSTPKTTTLEEQRSDDADEQKARKEDLLAYFRHGIGAKVLNPGIEQEIGDFKAMSTAFVGLGFDGPLFARKDQGTPADWGGIMLEACVAANATNSQVLEDFYGVDDADGFFLTANVVFRAFLPGRFSLDLRYGAPLGGRNDFIGEVVSFGFAYNR